MNREIKQIEFYCKKCRKSMKMSYSVTGDIETPVMQGMMIKCHTNKCVRVISFKKFTEGMLLEHTNAEGKYYV